jgi:hypothetical protein
LFSGVKTEGNGCGEEIPESVIVIQLTDEGCFMKKSKKN